MGMSALLVADVRQGLTGMQQSCKYLAKLAQESMYGTRIVAPALLNPTGASLFVRLLS